MKPVHSLILGSAIVGSAIAIGLHLATMGSRHGDRAPQAASPSLPSAPAKKRGLSISANTDSRAARVSEKSGLETQRDPAEPTPEFRIHGKPPAGRVADERDWFASAERIRQQANHDLGNLRETLELSPNQQQRIFDVLARNSPSWQPGMMTGGSYGVGLVSDGAKATRPSAKTRPEPVGNVSNNPEVAAPAPTINNDVLAVLDPDQQQALLNEESDRRAWWEEILPQLLPPEFPTAADADDPAASLIGSGDTKAYEGPTEILEE